MGADDDIAATNNAFPPRRVEGERLFGNSNEVFIRQPLKGWYVLRRYADGTLTLQKHNVSPRKRMRKEYSAG